MKWTNCTRVTEMNSLLPLAVTIRTLKAVLLSVSVGGMAVLHSAACFAQASDSPEVLPAPGIVLESDVPSIDEIQVIETAMPAMATEHVDARHYPLWADYDGQPIKTSRKYAGKATTGCQCGKCRPPKTKPSRSLFGKVAYGVDVMIFGTGGKGSSVRPGRAGDCGCDSGCDSLCVRNDKACDAMGPSFTQQQLIKPQPLHAQQQIPAKPLAVPQKLPVKLAAPEPSAPAPKAPAPKAPAPFVPVQKNEGSPAPLQDPFVDDPITVTGRAVGKPSSGR